MDAADDLTAVALLAEPIRRRLYLYLRERREPVGREEAARHVGVKARLAAFHLDRMAEAGLLEVEYRRLSGRVGPGAGRTAKVYSVSSRSFSVLIPQTRYALAASMMASALSAGGSGADGAESLQDVATAESCLAEGARLVARRRDDPAPPLASADHDGLPFQRGVQEALDGDEERVQVQATDPRARARD